MYTVVTKQGCPSCVKAKRLLDLHALSHVVVRVESVQEARDYLELRCNLKADHVTTVPQVVYEDRFDDCKPRLIGGYEQLRDSLTEPMLQVNDSRHTVYPVRHVEEWALYKKAIASFWTPEEISLSEDVDQYAKKLTPQERHFVSRILAFFASSDGIVAENLAANFLVEVQWPEARQFYSAQIFQEAIHAEVYSLLIDTLVRDAAERDTLFTAMQNVPCVQKKAEWAMRWINPKRTFAERLLAYVCVEGILFSGSFCAIYWLKQRGLMPGLTLSNEWISRDEYLHYTFGCGMYKKLLRKLPEQHAREIIAEAVDTELEFLCDALPCDMIGMNKGLMADYIKFVADRALADLGYPKKMYGTQNPFGFMELQSLNGSLKTNFFERTPSEYQRAGVLGTSEDREFGTDGMF